MWNHGNSLLQPPSPMNPRRLRRDGCLRTRKYIEVFLFLLEIFQVLLGCIRPLCVWRVRNSRCLKGWGWALRDETESPALQEHSSVLDIVSANKSLSGTKWCMYEVCQRPTWLRIRWILFLHVVCVHLSGCCRSLQAHFHCFLCWDTFIALGD